MSNCLDSITTHLKSTSNHRSIKRKVGIIKSLIERNSFIDDQISEPESSVSNTSKNTETCNEEIIMSHEPFSGTLRFNASIEYPMPYLGLSKEVELLEQSPAFAGSNDSEKEESKGRANP